MNESKRVFFIHFLFVFLGLKNEKSDEKDIESNNRTVTHMSPDDVGDEEVNSVTFLNRISSLISISNKIL